MGLLLALISGSFLLTLTSCPPAGSLASLSHLTPLLFGINSSKCCSTFGQNNSTPTLRNTVEIALEIQNDAPVDPLLPAATRVPSSFNTAFDTVSDDAFESHVEI